MRGYIADQLLPWKRFWVPWNGTIQCGIDGRGFLDNPESWSGQCVNGSIFEIESLIEEKRCLVLSGHPGIGKSVALQGVAAKLQDRVSVDGETISFHCRSIADPASLREETINHTNWRRARQAEAEINLLIDGVDEGLRKFAEFVATLTQMLRAEPVNKLRIVLACRSAEWDAAAGRELFNLWPDTQSSGVFELCPLQQKDAEAAAEACGVNPKSFIKAIHRNDVRGLAARPITLRMLLDEFKEESRFPESRYVLYSRAARRMCGDHDEDRQRSLKRHYVAPPEHHVFKVVSRLACLLMLTGKGTILKRDSEEPNATELPWKEAVGGNEEVDGEIIEVTEALVEAALETAHFSFRGEYRYGFDHPTFAELLGAEYLRSLGLTQLRQLLCHRFDDSEFVVPQLSELSAWLACSHAPWRAYLISNQPEILLRSDVTELDTDQKKRLLESLLARVDREEALDSDAVDGFYHTLKYRGIANQLRPYIVDQSRHWFVRSMAIEIAGATGASSLEPDLWKLVKSNDTAHNAITHALRRLAGSDSKANLLLGLRGKLGNDSNGDLKGMCLRILVPGILPVRGVLKNLHDDSDLLYGGSYRWALNHHLPSKLTVSDLPNVFRQLESWDTCFDTLSCFNDLAVGAFSLGLKNLNDPQISKTLVRMWIKKARGHLPLPKRRNSGSPRETGEGLGNTRLRRRLVEELLNSAAGKPDDLIEWNAPLVVSDDVPWLLKNVTRVPKIRRKKWAAVIRRLLWFTNREPFKEELLETYASSPELRKTLPKTTKGNIHETLCRYERAEKLRRERQKRRWLNEEKRLTRRELLDDALGAIDGGHPSIWVPLSERCFREDPDESQSKKKQSAAFDITASPGWEELTRSERRKAKTAARKFLMKCEDRRTKSHCSRTNYSDAAYYAIRLLKRNILGDEPLKRAVVHKWIPAVIGKFNSGETEHQEMVAFVYKLSPRKICDHLAQDIKISDERDGYALGLYAYEKCWDSRLSKKLARCILGNALKPRTLKHSLIYLMKRDRAVCSSVLRKLLDRQVTLGRFDVKTRALIHFAMFHMPDPFWDMQIRKVSQARVSSQRKFFLEHVSDLRHDEKGLLSRLANSQLADLYCAVVKLFPPEKYFERHCADGTITPAHNIVNLREQCLGILVSRGEHGAMIALRRIIAAAPRPRQSGLRWHYRRGLANCLRKRWSADLPEANDVLRMSSSRDASRITDVESLRETVLLSLSRLQTQLLSDGIPSIRELWNERKGSSTPKEEMALSNLLDRWLSHDLSKEKGIIINLEANVKRFGKGKQDLKIDASVPEANGFRQISVIVEVKRCNHTKVSTACKTQLIEGYLRQQNLTHGIYLVGWFGTASRATASWRDLNQAQLEVSQWAADAGGNGMSAIGVVLDCRKPHAPAPSIR